MTYGSKLRTFGTIFLVQLLLALGLQSIDPPMKRHSVRHPERLAIISAFVLLEVCQIDIFLFEERLRTQLAKVKLLLFIVPPFPPSPVCLLIRDTEP